MSLLHWSVPEWVRRWLYSVDDGLVVRIRFDAGGNYPLLVQRKTRRAGEEVTPERRPSFKPADSLTAHLNFCKVSWYRFALIAALCWRKSTSWGSCLSKDKCGHQFASDDDVCDWVKMWFHQHPTHKVFQGWDWLFDLSVG